MQRIMSLEPLHTAANLIRRAILAGVASWTSLELIPCPPLVSPVCSFSALFSCLLAVSGRTRRRFLPATFSRSLFLYLLALSSSEFPFFPISRYCYHSYRVSFCFSPPLFLSSFLPSPPEARLPFFLLPQCHYPPSCAYPSPPLDSVPSDTRFVNWFTIARLLTGRSLYVWLS